MGNLQRIAGFDGIELTPFHEVMEEGMMCFQPAMIDSLDTVLQFHPFLSGEQSNAGTLDGCVANLENLGVIEVWD